MIDGLPEAWLEDPALTPETDAVLEPYRDRVTWDALIHSVDDIVALRWPPKTVNVKPSRFGSVERLFAAYDYCAASGIGAYGGGQFELGAGRDHIQLLAALFHPETPNDVAPGAFNIDPSPGLPASPLGRAARHGVRNLGPVTANAGTIVRLPDGRRLGSSELGRCGQPGRPGRGLLPGEPAVARDSRRNAAGSRRLSLRLG